MKPKQLNVRLLRTAQGLVRSMWMELPRSAILKSAVLEACLLILGQRVPLMMAVLMLAILLVVFSLSTLLCAQAQFTWMSGPVALVSA